MFPATSTILPFLLSLLIIFFFFYCFPRLLKNYRTIDIGGIILETATDEFLLAGTGLVVTFENVDKNLATNIVSVDEESYHDGKEVEG